MPLPPYKFDEACRSFSEILVANGQHWKDYFGAAHSTRMRQAIQHVREACDTMEKILNEDERPTQPVRQLSEEEYQAKLAAGKKITFSSGGKL